MKIRASPQGLNPQTGWRKDRLPRRLAPAASAMAALAMPTHSTQEIEVTRHIGGATHMERDHVAVEEPLEIRLDGHPVAVLMRTPGHDEELAAGFLFTEGIIKDIGQIRKIDHREDENQTVVFLQNDAEVDLGRLTRHMFSASSCGLCGKATLESIFCDFPPLPGPAVTIPDDVLLAAPEALRRAQEAFETTGGIHGVGLFSFSGDLLIAREDIGRHNAVDKVIGCALLEKQDMSNCFLLVSGRTSFEILQKALAARIPAVAAVSAPSSLAVDFARAAGQSLYGFLRPPHFNCYTS